MTQGIIISPANKGVQVVVTDENNVQLLVDSNRGVNLAIVPQPRIEVLVDKGVEGAQGPVGPQGPQGPQGTAATVTAGTTTTGLAGTNAIVTNSGTSSAAVFDFIIPRGDTGLTGATGAGVAVGGTTGQVLVKASNVNYDTTWATITGTLVYQGSWNAATNTPTLTSSVGTNGYYYVVGTSGSTNLNGITDWVVGDWAIFNGTIWQKIDNTDLVSSVNGQTGVVVLTASSVGALAIANNLSDLANAPTARTNLGLGTAATQNSTAFATAAQGATADTALQTVTSVDGSIVVLQTGTNIDLAVSAASPASTLLTQVRNTTGATLIKGTVVYISGATGQISTVSKANASSDATSAQTLGMITANLANNSNGYVTVFGLLQNMDTSAYTDGAQLYLSGTVAGTVTATKPSAPIHIVYVAVVEYAHPTQGKLLVKVQNGYELAEIHDVSIVSPTTGQTLVYNASTDLWENSNAPVISGTTINNTTIGATTPSTGVFTTLTSNSTAQFGRSLTSYIQADGGTTPYVLAQGAANANVVFGSNGTGTIFFRTQGGGTTQAAVSHTASAVNYVQVTGNVTTSRPVISAQGSDANVGLNLASKGNRSISLLTNSVTAFDVLAPASGVNYLTANGSITGITPSLVASGTDTNIAFLVQSKGTGAIDLAAGSSGVNISNGGTVTAITGTAGGTAYTSAPTVAISAPTTAGGVQATASAGMSILTSALVSGGTGYTVNDALTFVGGTGTAVTITVTGVSGGVVTTYSISFGGTYTVVPTGTISTTGGTGTGATFSVSAWQVRTNGFTITNAGSGYVEQPTVTFSGGGGSGAAAYATVGAGSIIRALGSTGTQTLDIYTPSSISTSNPALRFRDSASADSYPMIWNFAGSGNIIAQGTTNSTLGLGANGTGAITFTTNGTGTVQQLRVTHTASAVNYVQVTGAATGGRVTISAQGSDANVPVVIGTKGSGSLNVRTNDSVTTQFAVTSTASAVNYINVTGSVASSAPTISSLGTDTNIDLNLTTKGTGYFKVNNGYGTHLAVGSGSTTAPNAYATISGDQYNRAVFGSSGSTVITAGGSNTIAVQTASTAFTQFAVTHTASAVNYVQVTGAATGGRAIISMQGSDTNIPAGFYTKGSGSIDFRSYGGSNNQFVISGSAVAVNYFQANGSITGFGPVLSAQGSDTNINAVVQPKGTGALQAQQTDSTATGGNARGARAVDWQTLRTAASQVASGFVATASGGYNNTVSGGVSVVGGGTQNTAAADLSSILGGIANSTPVSGAGNTYSFIGAGYQNNASGIFNVIGGGYLNSGTATATVTTQSGTMNGTTAVTLSGSNASIRVGQLVTGTSIQGFPNTYVAAISGTSLTLSQAASGSSTSTLSFFTPHGVVVGGGNNQATGSYSFIGGGGDAGTAANRNVASGAWSVVVGGWKNTASGIASFVGGGGNYDGTTVFPNTASGNSSVVVGGINNTSSALNSFIGGGYNNIANSSQSVVIGGVGGTTRGIVANHVFAASSNPISGSIGVSQAALLVIGRETTNATATVLTSDNGSAGTSNQVILPNNSAYYFKVEIIANVTGGGNTSGWELKGVIKRGANAASTTIVGSVTSTLIAQDAGASTWAVSATADTTNGGLKITCTGQASTTIRWVAKASTTEVTF